MRRSIPVATSAFALVGAMVLGPFGTAAAAPYVYGCTPATFYKTTAYYAVSLHIYNGSATIANLTHKVLAGDGTIINAVGNSPPITSTLPPTHTTSLVWLTIGDPTETSSTVSSTVRIVSNVPIAPMLSHETSPDDWKPMPCTHLEP